MRVGILVLALVVVSMAVVAQHSVEDRQVAHQGVKMGIYDIPGLHYARLWVYDLTTGKNAPIPNHPALPTNPQ